MTRAERIKRSWDEGLCANCGKPIPEGARVGSGRRADGSFCSLDCYAQFHGEALLQKARKIQSATDN